MIRQRHGLSLFLAIVLVAATLVAMPAPRASAASGTLDFGNTADGTTATTANTGFGGVRIGSGGGSFTIMNSGQEIGTQAELRGIAPTGGSINSVGVTSAEYGSAATTFTVSFEVYFSGGSNGMWYFFAGNGTSFGSAQSSGFTGSHVFTGLRFAFGSSSTITTNNRNGANWNATGITGTPFAQNIPYTVSIVGNNSSSTVSYGSEDLPAYKHDLWVNGVLVGDDLAKAELSDGTNINAFRFYGENSTGNVATVNLDNIRWWNQAVAPSISTYSTMSAIPAMPYSVLNVNSGSGSLAGNTEVQELLTLTNGLLTLGTSNLTLGAAATVGGTPSETAMVVATDSGQLRKTFTATGSFTFPVGDNTDTADYTPVTLNFSSGSFGSNSYAGVNLRDAKHPSNTSTTHYLTRYWTVTQSGISGFSCNTTFKYRESTDVVGTEGNLYTGQWNGANWTRLDPANTGADTLGGTVSSFSDFTGGESGAMAATLGEFGAAQQGDAILVSWETVSEIGNLGFNLWRGTSPSAPDQMLNSALIPSAAPGSGQGFSYEWLDSANLVSGTTYYYWLEDMDISGAITRHGPISAEYNAPTAVRLTNVEGNAAGGSLVPWLLLPAALAAAAWIVRSRRPTVTRPQA